MSSENPQDVNWLPWSEWMTEPGLDPPCLARHHDGVVDEGGLAAPVDGPAHDPAAVGVEDGAAVDLALARRVLGDVGEPEHVGPVHGEVALDQVLFGGLVDQVLLAPLRARESLDAQLAHDGEDQLLVDHHVLLSHQGGSDAQHPIGAPGPLVDVGDEALSKSGGSGDRTARGT